MAYEARAKAPTEERRRWAKNPGVIDVEIELTNIKNNPLLHRREVEFRVESPSTPSRGEIRRSLAVLLKVDLNQVYVREVRTKTGTHESVGWAHVYEDAEEALRVEPRYVVERNEFREPEEVEAQ